MVQKTQFGVVILGAGASMRMGTSKLLLPWASSTVIGHIISQWRELGAGQTIVVVRANDAALSDELDRLNISKADRIENPEPEQGMFSSILSAAKWNGWREEIQSMAIALGDQPHLNRETLRSVLAFHGQNPSKICQPMFNGRAGHPVIFPRETFFQLRTTTASTLKHFLKLPANCSVQCPVADAGLPFDMDTPEDYKRLLAQSRA